jgi:enoyl-CoA hydratase/carnithine racemase
MYRYLLLEPHGAALIVRMNRPEARNALSVALMEELAEFARGCEARADVRVVILAGGPDHFCAGADLKDPERWEAPARGLSEQRRVANAGYRMCAAWEAIPQMTLAAIEGCAIGGGLALALACDFRVAAAGAFVSLPEVSLGLPLTWGTVHRLVALVGPARAKRLTVLGERLAAPDAHALGLIDYLAAPGGAEARALELAAAIAALPEHSVRMSKETINAVANALLHLGSHMGGDQFALAAASEEVAAARERFAKRPGG